MRRKLLVASALATATLGIGGSALAVNTDGGTDLREQLAEKLATRFNLNKDEVVAFMDEEREARRAEMQAKVSEALKSAGFTDDQITALQTKKTEQREAMEAWREANPDATREEMKTQHDTEKAEFETWAEEQGIDLEKMRDTLKDSGLGRGMHGGHRGGMESGAPPDAPVTETE